MWELGRMPEERQYIIKAQYALRYRGGADPYGDYDLSSLQGRHKVDIYLPVDSGSARKAFMRDIVDEQYRYTDGKIIERSGFILTWFDHFTPLNREETKNDIENLVKDNNIQEVNIEEREEGIAVSFRNLRFLPDSPVFLPGEENRVGSIAQILKKQQNRTFLVVGHTADVGTVESQLELSVLRAKTVVDLLVSRGMDPELFLYRGVGGSQPIAPNDTEGGRALNRRVEIIIMEH